MLSLLPKGLGYGVPIGAFLSKEACMALEPGDHGSTFGGNALTTAAAYAGSKYLIEHNIPAHARLTGQHLLTGLQGLKTRFSFITEVRGKGLLAAMEFADNIAAQVLTHANAAGVLLNAVKPNAIRFMPPLTITTAEIDEGLSTSGAGVAAHRLTLAFGSIRCPVQHRAPLRGIVYPNEQQTSVVLLSLIHRLVPRQFASVSPGRAPVCTLYPISMVTIIEAGMWTPKKWRTLDLNPL